MKDIEQRSSKFELALNWVQSFQHKDNVFFRFIFNAYLGVSRTPWMTPAECLDYMQSSSFDLDFIKLDVRICA